MSEIIYLGFNSRVAALNRVSGQIAWSWKSPKGTGYVTILLDGELLVVSVQGYTYGLDATTGRQLWFQPLDGFGTGPVSMAGGRTGSTGNINIFAAEAQARAAAASAG